VYGWSRRVDPTHVAREREEGQVIGINRVTIAKEPVSSATPITILINVSHARSLKRQRLVSSSPIITDSFLSIDDEGLYAESVELSRSGETVVPTAD
jgi:hypothetical protein